VAITTPPKRSLHGALETAALATWGRTNKGAVKKRIIAVGQPLYKRGKDHWQRLCLALFPKKGKGHRNTVCVGDRDSPGEKEVVLHVNSSLGEEATKDLNGKGKSTDEVQPLLAVTQNHKKRNRSNNPGARPRKREKGAATWSSTAIQGKRSFTVAPQFGDFLKAKAAR